MSTTWVRAGAVALALAVELATFASADEEEVALSDCPAAVHKTLVAEARGAQIDTVSKITEDGATTYWAGVMIGDRDYGIHVAEDGTLHDKSLDIEDDELEYSQCPGPVRETLKREAQGANIDGVTKEWQYGTTVYQTEVTINARKYEIRVAEDGTLTAKTLQVEETRVALSDCPAAVRKTLRDETSGEVEQISRTHVFGVDVYSAAVKLGAKRYWIEVEANGTLFSKSLDEG